MSGLPSIQGYAAGGRRTPPAERQRRSGIMDRAAAGGPRRAELRSHPTAGLSGAVMSRYRTCRPAHGVYRRRAPLLPLDPPSKSAELILSGLKYYHDLHVISQPDKPLIN